MASAVGHISGGHFNPAVTFGFLVTRRILPRVAVAYWLAQLAGAAAAALLLRGVFSPDSRLDAGAPVLGDGVGAGSGLLLEGVLTFFLAAPTAIEPTPANTSANAPTNSAAARRGMSTSTAAKLSARPDGALLVP